MEQNSLSDFLIRRELRQCFFQDDMARLIRRLNNLDLLFADLMQAYVLFCEACVRLDEDFGEDFMERISSLLGLSSQEIRRAARGDVDWDAKCEYIKKIASMKRRRAENIAEQEQDMVPSCSGRREFCCGI